MNTSSGMDDWKKPLIEQIDQQIANTENSSRAMLQTLANNPRSKKLERQIRRIEEFTKESIAGLESLRNGILQQKAPATPAQRDNFQNWLKAVELAIRVFLGF